MSMKTTMKQLAEQLGLSRTTVSLVLQGKGTQMRISQETQQRIMEKAEELNFVPNYLATALSNGRTGTVGLILPDIFEGFMGSMIRGIEDVLYHEDLTIFLSTSRFDNDREQEIVAQMTHRDVDGIIMAPAAPFPGTRFDYSHIGQLISRKLPLVLVDRYIPGLTATSVIQADEELAFETTRQMLADGIDSITCIGFNLEITSLQDRVTGYRNAMDEAGKQPELLLLDRQDPDAHDISSYIENRIRSGTLPQAFLVTTSGLADKLIWLLQQQGIDVGDDIIVTKFGERQPWERSPVRTIRQPTYAMGIRAAEELLAQLSGQPTQGEIIRVR